VLTPPAQDASLLLDAAAHARRVSRAATVSGAILNSLTPVHVRPVVVNGKLLAKPDEPVGWSRVQAPPEDDGPGSSPVGKLEGLCAEQLRMSEQLHKEVVGQTLALESIDDALAAGTEKVRKLKI
jgi:hypothetical protein